MAFRYIPFKLPSQKRNAFSKTSEKEFDKEVKKMDLLQENTMRLQESTKKCMKAYSAKVKCDTELSESLQRGLGNRDETFKSLVDTCTQASHQLDAQTKEMDVQPMLAWIQTQNDDDKKNNLLNATMIDPLKRYSHLFPSMQIAIKKREQCLQDLTKYQEKVEKYLKRERTGINAVKLETSRKACAASKLEFDEVNEALLDDINVLYRHRCVYFHPCLQAFISCENNFYKDSEEIHADVCDKIKRLYPSLFNAKQQKNAKRDDAANSSDDEIADNIKSKLAEIKALSITVDDNR